MMRVFTDCGSRRNKQYRAEAYWRVHAQFPEIRRVDGGINRSRDKNARHELERVGGKSSKQTMPRGKRLARARTIRRTSPSGQSAQPFARQQCHARTGAVGGEVFPLLSPRVWGDSSTNGTKNEQIQSLHHAH